jgi:hypothetical protein
MLFVWSPLFKCNHHFSFGRSISSFFAAAPGILSSKKEVAIPVGPKKKAILLTYEKGAENWVLGVAILLVGRLW